MNATYCFLDVTVSKRANIVRSWYPDFMNSLRTVKYRNMALDFVEWKWCVEFNLN